MKNVPSYPFVLSVCMFVGPLLMIGDSFFNSREIRWAAQIAGALMVVFAFFYVSKRLHELMEEVAALKDQSRK